MMESCQRFRARFVESLESLETVFRKHHAPKVQLVGIVIHDQNSHAGLRSSPKAYCANWIWAITNFGIAWFQFAGSESNGKRKSRFSPGASGLAFLWTIGTRSR